MSGHKVLLILKTLASLSSIQYHDCVNCEKAKSLSVLWLGLIGG